MERAAQFADDFARDGAIHLPGIFADPGSTRCARGRRSRDGEVSRERSIYAQRDGSAPSSGLRPLEGHAGIPTLRRLWIGAIAATLMGAREVRLFHDHILVSGSIVTPWHQDTPYYCVTPEQSISFWISSLSDCANGLARVRRRHASRQSSNTSRSASTAPISSGDTRPLMPAIDADRGKWRILGWEMAPGDAIAFHYSTIHGAPANTDGGRRRRAVSGASSARPRASSIAAARARRRWRILAP